MMLQGLGNIFRVHELRKKILFTLGIIFVYRVGTHIPLPGINAQALAEIFKNLQGTTFGLFDVFTGGALSRAAVFAVGIMPYISASIILQLLTTTVPYLERLQKEGEHGRQKITQYTRYLTILVAAIQGTGVAIFLEQQTTQAGVPIVPNPGPMFMFTTIVSLIGGTMFLMWLGEQITERGIGNGISVIIFAGTLDSVPNEFLSTLQLLKAGTVSPIVFLFVLAFYVLVTAAVVAVTEAQRRIPIQYAKRIVGRKIYGGQSTYLPLTVNTAGVIPIIFAQSLLMFPSTIASLVNKTWMDFLSRWFSPVTATYNLLYALLIIFFGYYYTSVVMNPKDLADNLQRYSGFIPGVRPGPKTSEYIDRVMARILLPGTIFFAFIAIFPHYLMKWTNRRFYYGGTRLLIIVGVALEIMQQIEAHLIMRQYEGLLKKGRIRGWRG